MGVLGKAVDFVGCNSKLVDAREFESDIRSSDPRLLQADEKVIFAFRDRGGKGRDSSMFTNKRYLIKDKRGVTGKRIRYTSIPYTSIRAFSLETPGDIDDDAELKLYPRGKNRVKLDLVKSTDIVPLQNFLSDVVIRGKGAGHVAADDYGPAPGTNVGSKTSFLDLLGSNYSQQDGARVEQELRASRIIMDCEKVELAFKCGRDSFIMTSHRVLKIDVQGLGRKVEYLSILWAALRGFSIETAGNIIDRDSELTLFFNLPDSESAAEGSPRNSKTRMGIDFRSTNVDIFAVNRFISDKLLGPDTVAASQYGGAMAGQQDTGSGSLLAWLGDDNRLVDANEANQKFHYEIPLLQGCETVELAFKGRRDMLLFTSKRIVVVDIQGFLGMGKKVEYLSVPWRTCTAFAVRSAGSWIDKDSEMCLWMDYDDVFNPRRSSEDDPPPPPIPRKSYIEIDFQKDKVDIFMVHNYLSERLMRADGHNLRPFSSPVPSSVIAPVHEGTNILDWVGDNNAATDPHEADARMRPLLQDDEHVAFAFKCGRDSFYITNKRLFVLDVQGITGKRKEFMSVPMDLIRAWSVESAGNFDRDMELRVWFKGFWDNKVKKDLKKGRADIFAIQSFIAHFVIGNADGRAALANHQAHTPLTGAMTKLMGFLDDGHTKDPVELTQRLRSDPPLLQEDESVEVAVKSGRDKFLVTTKRVIVIDRKGITGKSTEFKSFPLMYLKVFRVETEGHMLNGSEMKIYGNGFGNIDQGFSKKDKQTMWNMHEILSDRLLNNSIKELDDEVTFVVDSSSLGGNSSPSYTSQTAAGGGGHIVQAQVIQPQTTFPVQVPPGVVAGQQLQFAHPTTGQMLLVAVPPGVQPGQTFNVTA
mmetsp:Transcript_33213/g.75862  ORF Transcript_33213/g.75862 Transcript_33213/m.75862 type:complete len:868 (-) Transcript_33213:101-2704(-)